VTLTQYTHERVFLHSTPIEVTFYPVHQLKDILPRESIEVTS